MAFDFEAFDVAPYAAKIRGGGKVKERRAAAVALYADASEAGGAVDWRAVSALLVEMIPTPRTGAEPIEIETGPDAGEWADYTDAQRRGKGGLFHAARAAQFRFADGELVGVNLLHRAKLDCPDWHRAARMAVHFYRARRARNFRELAEMHGPSRGPDWPELYSEACAVPAIVEGIDVYRQAAVNVEAANAATAELRSGETYLARYVEAAREAGHDWPRGIRNEIMARNLREAARAKNSELRAIAARAYC